MLIDCESYCARCIKVVHVVLNQSSKKLDSALFAIWGEFVHNRFAIYIPIMRCAHVILLSGLLSVTLANDILFYDSNLGCDGSFSGCFNAAKNVCCPGSNTGVKWMSISKGPYDFAVMYSGGGCTREFCVRIFRNKSENRLTDFTISNSVLVLEALFAAAQTL